MIEGDINLCAHSMLLNIYPNYSKKSANHCYLHLKKLDLKTKKLHGEPKKATITYILMVKNLIYSDFNVGVS